MRRLLAAAVLAVTMPAANAQDKGKTDFSINGELRITDLYKQNPFGNADWKGKDTSPGAGRPTHANVIEQRLKLGMKFKANEKVSVNTTLIQSGNWGQGVNETNLGNRASFTNGANNTSSWQATESSNFMSVNEAYASWMLMDNFTAKFGRQNYGFGDGTVMNANQALQQPYAFDGFVGTYEMEVGKLEAFAFKYRSLFNSQTTDSDGGHHAYGLVFDLKTMPEILKAVNVHVIQDTADGVWAATANQNTVHGTQNQNTLRWGLMAKVAVADFDLKGNYEMVGGKYSDAAAGGAVAKDRTVKMSMYQVEAGYTLPALMQSRFSVKYHVDSGTSAADQAAGETAATYDGYFYDRTLEGGAMFVGWGNLTATSIHWTFKPSDTCMAGVNYWIFQKTDGGDISKAGYQGAGNFLSQSLTPIAPTADEKKDLGTAIEAWGMHSFESGVKMLVGAAYWTPGGYMKDTTIDKGDAILGAKVSGWINF